VAGPYQAVRLDLRAGSSPRLNCNPLGLHFVVEIFDIAIGVLPSNLLVSSEPSIAGRHQISPLQTSASRLEPSANLAPHCEKARTGQGVAVIFSSSASSGCERSRGSA
jgi:hypothetical protein